jgi:hypothetical protein
MPNTAFYEARAGEARLAAAAAPLANVRDRCLRAAAAWEAMAIRAGRMDRHRADEVIRRAERDEAAAPIVPAAFFARRRDR